MDERVLFPISDAELERRWSALRAIMSEGSVGALIVQNNNDWLGGYVKWLTDLPSTNGYPTTMIFHLDDLMTVIEMGPKGGYRALHGDDQIYRGVGLIAITPAFTSVRFTDHYQSTLVLEDIKRRGYYTEAARTIVFGRPNQQLTEGFAAMRAAQAHTLSLIRPGASCREIAAAHDDYLLTNGLPTELRLYREAR
jgi:hypothetical protein